MNQRPGTSPVVPCGARRTGTSFSSFSLAVPVLQIGGMVAILAGHPLDTAGLAEEHERGLDHMAVSL